MLFCDIKENRQKACKYNQLPNLIQTMLSRKVWWGVQICEEGFISANGFGPGRVQIRGGTGVNRDFKIQDATASRTRWLIKDWD